MPIKLLAVDTALGACSVAVLEGDAVRAHHFAIMERGHAEALAPMVQEAMREAGLAFAELDRLAVTTGPGTFTGQRVGLAFMRGLRVALKKPLAGVTTLDAMAAAALAEAQTSRVAVLHDAKRGEVYVLMTGQSGPLVPLQLAKLDDAIAAIEEAANAAGSGPLAFAGTAGEVAAETYRAHGGAALLTEVRQPDALWAARLAMAAPEPQTTPKPLYLRAPDAKLPASASGTLRLRAATQDDLGALASLHALCFAQGWSARSIGQLLGTPGSFALLAESGGAACGFILIRVAADEAEILSIGVAPRARRAGTGRKLVAAASAKAQQTGAATIFLEVARENEAARALYAAAGFGEAGLRQAYYREPGGKAEDALVLKANLPLL
ncbi:MAG: tRNA (adenosine(37)-N6)-threonylcarbamoyltransferase complex dimerization subunit type 1 TsaB [Rhizomicrobium sp.]|jgi:tRNA threonylcarbamoyladenosine biosynthesis protein TsaB